ncbi:MAG: hypothetical protein ACTHJT_06015 [Cytophaga sp.]|uniref:hypothetical protein n=1 Tax=Cytophaga sp. TaxID=29535 RepID=UPI003F80E70C
MELNLNFIDASENHEKYRASIHLTGKLGFNMDANNLMELSGDKYYKVAFEPQTSNFNRIYLVESSKDDPTAAKVNKAGQYYFLKLAHVLNRLKVDYKTVSLRFLVEKAELKYQGQDVYILERSSSNKRDKKDEGADEIDAAE